MVGVDYFAGDPRTNRERRLAGEHYIADDPLDSARGLLALQLANQYLAAEVEQTGNAREILSRLLGHLGENAYVKPPIYVDFGERISVGDRTFINSGLTALDVAAITIGSDCQIGPNVQLLTPTHPVAPQPRRDRLESAQPITIGNNVWLGGGVIVCPGVSIGDNTVVGAGSVVVSDLPSNVVAVGNPAKVVRTISEDEPWR